MLTPKEKIVLELIASGLSTKEIAEKLCISFFTAQTHRKNIRTKMQVRNSAEMVVKAFGLMAA